MILAYLDEVSNNVDKAIEILLYNNIQNVVVRDIYTETQLASIKNKLVSNCVSVRCFTVDDFTDKNMLMASYIGAEYICSNHMDLNVDRLRLLNSKMIGLNIKPMLLFKPDCDIFNIVKFLVNTNCSMLYDPSEIIKINKCDHISKYWVILKKWVKILNAHDYKTGYGAKPIGVGDCKFDILFQDFDHKCMVALRHCLGSKYLDYNSSERVFGMALDALNLHYNRG